MMDRNRMKDLVAATILAVVLLAGPALPAMAATGASGPGAPVMTILADGDGGAAGAACLDTGSKDQQCPGGRCKGDGCEACCEKGQEAECSGSSCKCENDHTALLIGAGLIGLAILLGL